MVKKRGEPARSPQLRHARQQQHAAAVVNEQGEPASSLYPRHLRWHSYVQQPGVEKTVAQKHISALSMEKVNIPSNVSIPTANASKTDLPLPTKDATPPVNKTVLVGQGNGTNLALPIENAGRTVNMPTLTNGDETYLFNQSALNPGLGVAGNPSLFGQSLPGLNALQDQFNSNPDDCDDLQAFNTLPPVEHQTSDQGALHDLFKHTTAPQKS